MTANDDDFEARARSDLRRIVDETNPALRARIDTLASGAIGQAGRPRRNPWPALVPVGGVAAAAVAIVAVSWLWPDRVEPGKSAPIAADDVALLLNMDNLDLLEQMEFYLWVEQQPGALDAAGATAPELPQRS
jgi:hypothetical protein